MDFNQTARDTLTQVQSELAQGKAEISWAVYEPIANLDAYRKWIKKTIRLASLFYGGNEGVAAGLYFRGFGFECFGKYWRCHRAGCSGCRRDMVDVAKRQRAGKSGKDIK